MDYNRFSNLVPQSLLDAVTEALKGGQKKLDVDGDGKLEKSDFEKIRKNKKPEDCDDMQEGAKEDKPPFDPPYSKPGERKDEYGNKVKNVAKFLARKAMNKLSKEGYMPTADEPSDADKKTAQKVRGLLSKEKKLKKEEVEELDEISSDMAQRYLKGKSERDYNTSSDGKTHTMKKPMGLNKINRDIKGTVRALKTIEKSKKTNEEVGLEEENVLIHAPGNKHHGKQARVFHKHDDGRVNVQLKHSSKKGDVSNFTLQPNQFTPTEVKEDMGQASRADKAKKAGAKLQMDPDTGTPDHFTAAARRKKGLPEEAEGLREISAKAVDSYREKAYAQQPAGDDGSQLYKKRKAGRDMAFKKVTHGAKVMAKEGTEQISELSNKVLKSYIKGASNQAFSKGYSGGAMTVRGDMNRDSEEEKAGEKNVNSAIKRVSGINKAVNKLKTEAATPGVAAGSLPNGEHMCATNIMHKEWKEGQPIPTMHAEPDANGLIEWYDIMFEHGIERVMTEDMEILQAESHMHSKKKMKKEEVEHPNCGNPECCGECDTAELSQEELDFVASLNSTELDEKHTVKYALKNPAMGGKISAAHYDSKEDAEKFLQSVKKKGGNGVVSSVKEEVELDEARGRGRPSAASKEEEDEPDALGMQLRKAKSINKPVTFANKETKEVHPRHVSAFNDHMDARRTTQEKAAFQKRAHASHAEFVKAVSEKVPAKAKDTGEIIKYR